MYSKMSPHFFFFTNYFKRTSFSLSKVKHTAQHTLSLSHTHTLSLSHTHTHTHLQTHLSTQIAGPGLVGFELLSDNGEVDLMGGKTCEIDIYTNKGLYFTFSCENLKFKIITVFHQISGLKDERTCQKTIYFLVL